MSLDSQTKKVALVINFPPNCDIDNTISKLENYLKDNVIEYYFILHDSDTDGLGGPKKTKHLHVVFLLDKKARLLTIINRFCNAIYESDKYTNLFSIQSVKDYDCAIAYLVHKNDKFKFQYDSKLVKTNNEEYLRGVLNSENSRELSIDYIEQLCDECTSSIDVLKKVGLWNAKTYLNVIAYIWQKHKGLPF